MADQVNSDFDLGPAPERSYFSEGLTGGIEGIKSSLYGLAAAGGRGFGAKQFEQSMLAKAEEHAQRAGEGAMKVEDIGGVGDAVNFAKYSLGQVLPSSLSMLGVAALGRWGAGMAARNSINSATKEFAKNVGSAVGGVGASAALETGGIFPEAVKTGVENPLARSVVGGLAAGALDLPAQYLIGRRLGLFGKEHALSGVLGRGGWGGAAKTIGADLATNLAFELPQEAAQSFIERAAAGQPTTGPEAYSDYLNSAAAVAPMALLGVPGSGYRGFKGPAAPVTIDGTTGLPVDVPRETSPAQPGVATVLPGVPPSGATVVPPAGQGPAEAGATGFGDQAEALAARQQLQDRIVSLNQEINAPDRKRVKQDIVKDIKTATKHVEDIDLALPHFSAPGTSDVERHAPYTALINERGKLATEVTELDHWLKTPPVIRPPSLASEEDAQKRLKEAKSRLKDLDRIIPTLRAPSVPSANAEQFPDISQAVQAQPPRETYRPPEGTEKVAAADAEVAQNKNQVVRDYLQKQRDALADTGTATANLAAMPADKREVRKQDIAKDTGEIGKRLAWYDHAISALDSKPGGANHTQFLADYDAYKGSLEANGIKSPDDPRAVYVVDALNRRAARNAEGRPVDEGVKTAQATKAILDKIDTGIQHPNAAPWVGRKAGDTGPIILPDQTIETLFKQAARREGGVNEEYLRQFRAAAGEAPLTTGLSDAQIGIVSQFSGTPEDQIKALSKASQRKLFDTYFQQAEDQAKREAGGALMTSTQGDELVSPAAAPNVPGDRSNVRGEFEDKAARKQPTAEDIAEINAKAAQHGTKGAQAAASSKASQIDRLDTIRKERDALIGSPAYRLLKRRAEVDTQMRRAGEPGLSRSDSEKETWQKAQAKRHGLDKQIFTLEASIYETGAKSDLGSSAASGGSERPFRGSKEEHAEFFRQRALDMAAKAEKEAVDRLEEEWRLRQEMRNQARAEDVGGSNNAGASGAEKKYAGKTGNKTHAPLKDGMFVVDEDGFVLDRKGVPIQFGHQRDAGWWILKTGNKMSPRQIFQIANHPGGREFTVQQTGIMEQPQSAGAVVPAGDLNTPNPEQKQSGGFTERTRTPSGAAVPENGQEVRGEQGQPAGGGDSAQRAAQGQGVGGETKDQVIRFRGRDVKLGDLSQRDLARVWNARNRPKAEKDAARAEFQRRKDEKKEDPRLAKKEYREVLKAMGQEAGWQEVGGHAIRGFGGWEKGGEPAGGEVEARTGWVGKDWWRQRPDDARIPGDLTGARTRDAVDKAIAGKKLTAIERRAVRNMLDWYDEEKGAGDQAAAEQKEDAQRAAGKAAVDGLTPEELDADGYGDLTPDLQAEVDLLEGQAIEAFGAKQVASWREIMSAYSKDRTNEEFLRDYKTELESRLEDIGEPIGQRGPGGPAEEAIPSGQGEGDRGLGPDTGAADAAAGAGEEGGRLEQPRAVYNAGQGDLLAAPAAPPLELVGQTNEEILAAEAKAKADAEALAKAEADAAKGKPVKIDQADLFNTQGSLLEPGAAYDALTKSQKTIYDDGVSRIADFFSRHHLGTDANPMADDRGRTVSAWMKVTDAIERRLVESGIDKSVRAADGTTHLERTMNEIVGLARGRQLEQPRDTYTSDLFGAPLYVPTKEQTVAKLKTPQPQAQVPGATFATVVQPATTGTIMSGVSTVTSAADAAHLLASMRKSPQERFFVLVLGVDNKPISVLRIYAGDMKSISVSPEVVAKSVYQTPGAASIWYAHNHPSGLSTPSTADEMLTAGMSRIFGEGTGINVAGHVVIGGKKFSYMNSQGDVQSSGIDIPAHARTFPVPIKERTVRVDAKLRDAALSSPSEARTVAMTLLRGATGIVFLDTQNRAVGTLEMSLEAMLKLRSGPGAGSDSNARRLFAMAGLTNANTMLMYHAPTKAEDPDRAFKAIQNLGAAGRLSAIKLIDAIVNDKSYAESGRALGEDRKFFYSNAATNAYDEKQIRYQAIGQEVAGMLDRMLGGSPDLDVRLFEQRAEGGFAGRYRTTATKDLIELAYNAKTPMSVAAHEAFHRIETKHLLGQERAILNRALKKDGSMFAQVRAYANKYDSENGTNLTDEIDALPQEAHAYAYQFWKEGNLQAEGALARVFEKIKQFLDRVRNYLDGYGFRDINDLFEAVDRGDFRKSDGNVFITDATGAYAALDDMQSGQALNAPTTPAPIWFSQLERALDNTKLNSASPEQWKATIRGLKGVKADEIQWSGVNEWLDVEIENRREDPEFHVGSEKITRDEVMDFLRHNGVSVEETVLGEAGASDVLTPDEVSMYDMLVAKGAKQGVRHLTNDEINVWNELRRKVAPVEVPTKFANWQLPGGPLSRDTELLTDSGWKRIDEMMVGDIAMTRADDGALEWAPVTATHRVFADRLYHFKNQSIDMLTTANHQMVVKRRRRSSQGVFRTTAEQLWKMAECVVPLTGSWSAVDQDRLFELDAGDVAEFIGWYIAEGSYKHKNGVKTTLQIAQSKTHNPAHCARLEALFDRLGLGWKYYGEAYGVGIKKMPKGLKELLHAQPTSAGKFVPSLFMRQPIAVIERLLVGLFLGDGHLVPEKGRRTAKQMFFSKSARLAGDVQALCLLVGKRASVRLRPSGIFVVAVCEKQWASIDDAKSGIVSYDDFAFCVTVKNHAIYVRRNGVAAFTGNSNYRELLLTLPSPDRWEGTNGAGESRAFALHSDAMAFAGEGGAVQRTNEPHVVAHGFLNSHFDQPNILAHVRFNERTDADGNKVLFLEEIQSDWNSAGRHKGFAGPRAPQDYIGIKGRGYDALKRNDLLGYDSLGEVAGDLREGILSLDRADMSAADKAIVTEWLQAEKEQAKGSIPKAPFVQKTEAWVALSLKRMIRYAAENGFDRVAWTTGEQQAERYDLSKQVHHIDYNVNEDGSWELHIDPVNGQTISREVADRSGLEELVGKDVAEKIVMGDGAGHTDGTRRLTGLDLKVGGEGMKAFYDKIVPNVANDVLKKLGGGKVSEIPVSTKLNVKAVYNPPTSRTPIREWNVVDRQDRILAVYEKEGDARLAAATRSTSQQGFDITPALREKVMGEGMSLFSKMATIPIPPATVNDQAIFTNEVLLADRTTMPLKAPIVGDVYQIHDPVTHKHVGGMLLTRNVNTGRIVSLNIIDVGDEFRGKQWGEKAIRAVLSAMPQNSPLIVRDILPTEQARGFWSAMGTDYDQGEEYATGTLTRQSYLDTAGRGQASPVLRKDEAGVQGPERGGEGGGAGGDEYFSNAALAKPQTETPEFRRWFGDSKVVDENGRPLRLYHATPNDFSAFKPGGENPSLSGPAIWMTPNPRIQQAAHNADVRYIGDRVQVREGTRVLPLYANISRPLIIDDTTRDWAATIYGKNFPYLIPPETLARVRADGYDGVFLFPRSSPDVMAEVISFDDTQVKSAIGNNGSYDPGNPDILYSNAALNSASLKDIIRGAQNGENVHSQLMAATADALHTADIPKQTASELIGPYADAGLSAVKRAYLSNISSGNNIAKQSKGFANTFAVLTAYAQRKNRLIADSLEVGLSEWIPKGVTAGGSAVDTAAAGKALMERTVGGFQKGSTDYQRIYAALNPAQKRMFDQANTMVANMLAAEFEADKPVYKANLSNDEYYGWETARKQHIQKMIEEGYVPERRYGDHAVYISLPTVDEKGKPRNITISYELFESQQQAQNLKQQYAKMLETIAPELKVEYGFRYKPQFDASLSFKQFLDMARRHDITLSQQERERLAKALISADSTRRARIFMRKNIPGYSEDATRVLAEFAVNISNKVAYTEFSSAAQDALKGKRVEAKVVGGKTSINVDQDANVWMEDGENAGYYRALAERTANYAMGPQEQTAWSRVARMAAGLQFLGGSAATAVVQLSSIPINVVPQLFVHTSYGNAWAQAMSAMKMAISTPELRNLTKLQDPKIAIAGVSPELRQFLTRAGEDGTTLDTELYQLMGMTRGGMAGKSRVTQRAIEAWMTPFRWSEQINRVSTFIAAYKVGQEKKMGGDELYKFAQQMVYDTQFRYDEANRPAVTRNPIWALLYTFKSYPIFMTEMIAGLYKEKPGAAAAMLGFLTLAAGTNGIPFSEDLQDLIDTIAQRVFGVPFNSKRAMRNLAKQASEALTGHDFSGLFLNGAINEFTDLNFAGRVGLGNIIPGTRILAADSDAGAQAKEMLGAVGSMGIGMVKGAGDLLQGNFGAAAKEAAPAAVQNVIKGYDQFSKGYAENAKGQKLADVSGVEAIFQSLGFSSSNISKAYEADRVDKQTSAYYNMMRQQFVHEIVKGVRDGDREKVSDTVKSISEWNAHNPDMPIRLDAGSLRRSIMQAGLPIAQRTLQTLPKGLRGGSESMHEVAGVR